MLSKITLFLAFILTAFFGYMTFVGPDCLTAKLQINHDTEFLVSSYESKTILIDRLQFENIIKNSLPSTCALTLLNLFVPIRKGLHIFKPGMTIWDMLTELTQSRKTFSLTIPEGWTVGQIVKLLQEKPTLSGDISTLPSEGSLFPSTYHYYENDSRDKLIEKMSEQMNRILKTEWVKRQKTLPYLNPQQALVMASIIEKETALNDEKPCVAAVFLNRLEKNMPLQADPTVIYGLTLGLRKLDRPLTRRDWQDNSVFNTYKVRGLPPTPIACPGQASIRAALNPSDTDALYFVASGNGGHVFSNNLESHNKKVNARKKTS